MARKSRKDKIAFENSDLIHENVIADKIYNTALYVRKSCKDMPDEGDVDSINTQISMLEKYIEDKPDLRLFNRYIDNGETGTKFDRPNFNRLMDDIRSNKVDCVVVKDLSRFGRNYMEAGSLLETVFPYLGVRFIAVNEGYDSISEAFQKDTLVISIENLLNDLYAKDISKKINSVYLEGFKSGKYMGAYAPYGYMRSQEDKHKLIVDKEVAAVVAKIFELKAEGMTYQGIVNYLNAEGIESPSNYKYRLGILKDKRFSKDILWFPSVVKKMLCSQMYLGHMVQGKQQCRNSTQRNPVYLEEKDWYIVENTHEAIISKELWDKVQCVVAEIDNKYKEHFGKYKDRFQPNNFLYKKIICTECGKYLRRGHQCKKDYIIYNYFCATIHKDGSRCSCRYHNEDKLFSVVFDAIKQQIKLALDTKKLLEELEKMPCFNEKAVKLQRELSAAENKLKKTNSTKMLLYNDYCDGFINLEDYNNMRLQYENDIAQLTTTIESLKLELHKQKNLKSTKNKWIVEFEKFKRKKSLTSEIVTALIDKIYVHGQYELEIVFNFRDEYLYLLQEINGFEEALK